MTSTTTTTPTSILKIYTLTFNCARSILPPTAISNLAAHLFDALPSTSSTPAPPHPQTTTTTTTIPPRPKATPPPEILVLSLQEVAPIAYAFRGSRGEGEYLDAYLAPFRRVVDLAAKTAFPDDAGGEDRGGDEGASGEVEYINIITRNVGLTAIMVFVLREEVRRVGRVEVAGVGVGVEGMGNKGAVGVRMGYELEVGTSDGIEGGGGDENGGDSKSTSIVEIVVVAAHLAPMEDKLERRNEDWKGVCRGLVFEPVSSTTKTTARLPGESSSDRETEPLLSSTSSSNEDAITPPPLSGIYTPTAHLILAGDLNYRTSIAGPMAEEFRLFPQPCPDDSYPQHYQHLFQSDQLTAELRAQRTCQGLREAPVDFPPTYKYSDRARRDAEGEHRGDDMDAEGRHWEWAKHRWPSWCDRVLYLPLPSWQAGGATVKVRGYTALPLLSSSDHRPVACCLEIPAKPISEPPPSQDGDTDINSHKTGAIATPADQVRMTPPFPLDPDWKVKRTWAKRRESVVGLGAYLSLTWEGRGILLALVCATLGAWAVIGGLAESSH